MMVSALDRSWTLSLDPEDALLADLMEMRVVGLELLQALVDKVDVAAGGEQIDRLLERIPDFYVYHLRLPTLGGWTRSATRQRQKNVVRENGRKTSA